jgi:hypothetical protein
MFSDQALVLKYLSIFPLQVLRPFAARPDASSLVAHICKEKGEDRWLTLLLMELADTMQPRGLRAFNHLGFLHFFFHFSIFVLECRDH